MWRHGQRVVCGTGPLQSFVHCLEDVLAVEPDVSIAPSRQCTHRTVLALAPLIDSSSCSDDGCRSHESEQLWRYTFILAMATSVSSLTSTTGCMLISRAVRCRG